MTTKPLRDILRDIVDMANARTVFRSHLMPDAATMPTFPPYNGVAVVLRDMHLAISTGILAL